MPNLPSIAPDEAANERRESAIRGRHPGFERASDHIGELVPERKPELIRGVLRQGHKLLLAAQSKSGKTWMMLDLALSVANGYESLEAPGWRDGDGAQWLGRECRRGEVVLFDGEMDTSSLWNRIDMVARAKWPDDSPAQRRKRGERLHVRSLRGDLDATAAGLLDVLKDGFGDEPPALTIFDPIYKLLQGDENSNSDMREFLRALDGVAAYGPSIAMTHHHAKGRGGDRSVIDRAAGAGAFARDPDAFIDLTQLDIREGADEWKRLERALPKGMDEDGTEWQDRLRRTKVYRANYVLREFPDGWNHELMFDFPLMVSIDGFSGTPEMGSQESNRLRGAEATRSKADERWTLHDSLLTDAIDQLEADGVAPTRDAAYAAYVRRCEEEGEPPVSEGSFRNQTKPSGTRLSWVVGADGKTLERRGEQG